MRSCGIGSMSDGKDSVNRSPPTENSTSYWSRILRIGPCMRAIAPRNNGCDAGNDAVDGTSSQYTGAPISSASSISSACALDSATASPAMISGRLASARMVAACLTAAGSPRSCVAMRVGTNRSTSPSALRTSPGNERKTGPVGGASAVLAAR